MQQNGRQVHQDWILSKDWKRTAIYKMLSLIQMCLPHIYSEISKQCWFLWQYDQCFKRKIKASTAHIVTYFIYTCITQGYWMLSSFQYLCWRWMVLYHPFMPWILQYWRRLPHFNIWWEILFLLWRL